MPSRIYGFHAVEEVLKRGGVRGSLFLSKPNRRSERLADYAGKSGISVTYDPDIHDALLVVTTSHKGQSSLNEFLASEPSENSLVLLLDGITDPQNLGAILRSADGFGVDLVVSPARRSAGTNEVVDRASSGASRWVPVSRETNLNRGIQTLKQAGYWIYGADTHGITADTVSLSGRIALVLGSEGDGLSRLVKENCDSLLRITTIGHVDSLNVSVAAGILLYEIRRQQKLRESGSDG